MNQTPAAPDTPEYEAWKIVSGPGTIDEREARLLALLEVHPYDQGVEGWLEALSEERNLQGLWGKGGGTEEDPQSVP